jgi:spermidine synthase
MLTPDRWEELRRVSRQEAAVNEDFSPVLYYHHLLHWTSRFEANPRLAGLILLVALTVYLLRTPPVPLVIFASGLAATALEVVVLLGLQALCGSLYSQLGMIVTVFMAGLVAGAFLAGRVGSRSPRKALAVLGFALAVFAVLLPFALKALGGIASAGVSGILLQAAIALLTCALAALVGMQFPLAARAEAGSGALVASRLYAADFLGASLGAILAAALAIPLLGVTMTCSLTGGLCAVAAGILLLRRT